MIMENFNMIIHVIQISPKYTYTVPTHLCTLNGKHYFSQLEHRDTLPSRKMQSSRNWTKWTKYNTVPLIREKKY